MGKATLSPKDYAELGITREQDERLRARPATIGDIVEMVTDDFAPVIKEFVQKEAAKQVAVLADQIKAREEALHGKAVAFHQRMQSIETRIAALERAPLSYQGVWDEHRECNENEFYTHDGSIWFCKRATRAKPGTDRDCWTLSVKRGQNGK